MKKNKGLGQAAIAESVTASLDDYLRQLDGEPVGNLHELVMGTVEKTLIIDVLGRVGNNQSEAAAMLGINRNTLRSKLNKYGIKLG
ncbi:MAG: helix-turn-helix domain-containing protein [Casimicrobiaceae bacterium]